MGLLTEGAWHDRWCDTRKTGSQFVRAESRLRNWVTGDGHVGHRWAGHLHLGIVNAFTMGRGLMLIPPTNAVSVD